MKKKWTFGILILVVIGIVLAIVFVNLFKPKNTHELSTNINTMTTTGYLSEESDEYQAIDKYLESMENLLTGEDAKAVENLRLSYNAFVVEGKFFSRHIYYSTYTDTYAKQYKKISKKLKAAQKAANSLRDQIIESKNITVSGFWTANTWNTFKDEMNEIFDNTFDAFSRMHQVFMTSVKSKLINNDFTKLVFLTVEHYGNQVKQNQSAEGVGSDLNDVVQTYLNRSENSSLQSPKGEDQILQFLYNEKVQNDVKKLLTDGFEGVLFVRFISGDLYA